jgi:hypothetical protein
VVDVDARWERRLNSLPMHIQNRARARNRLQSLDQNSDVLAKLLLSILGKPTLAHVVPLNPKVLGSIPHGH